MAGADGWTVTPEGHGTVSVVGARAPDRVSWHVTGRVQGAVEWELDDLDGIAFAYGTWEVGPARTLQRIGEKAARRAHDAHATTVAERLAAVLEVDLLTVRADMRQPRQPTERPHRAAGAMLLGAAWLAGNGRRD